MELIVVLSLADVELGLEIGQVTSRAASYLAVVLITVEILKKAKEGGEPLIGVTGAREEDGHCVGRCSRTGGIAVVRCSV